MLAGVLPLVLVSLTVFLSLSLAFCCVVAQRMLSRLMTFDEVMDQNGQLISISGLESASNLKRVRSRHLE